MRKSEIVIGRIYMALVSKRLTRVRIDSTAIGGGWHATNLATRREVHIGGSGQRLRQVDADQTGSTEAAAAALAECWS